MRLEGAGVLVNKPLGSNCVTTSKSLSLVVQFGLLRFLDFTQQSLSRGTPLCRTHTSVHECHEILNLFHAWSIFFSYMIMKMCWNLEPTERPTFNKIIQMIERLLGDQSEPEQVSMWEAGLGDLAKHVTLKISPFF